MRWNSFVLVCSVCIIGWQLQGVSGRRVQPNPSAEIFELRRLFGLAPALQPVIEAAREDAHESTKYLQMILLDPSASLSPVLHGQNSRISGFRTRTGRRMRKFGMANTVTNDVQESDALFQWVSERLEKTLPIEHLEVIDVSDGHAMEAFLNGSNRALDPEGLELRLTVVSSAFDNKKTMQRQRMVNKALESELLAGSIHALPRLKTLSVDQWQKVHEKHRAEIEDMKQSFGSEHPMMLQALSAYADALEEISCLVEAEPLRRSVLEMAGNKFGISHEETIKAMKIYAETLEGIGRGPEAASLKAEIPSEQR